MEREPELMFFWIREVSDEELQFQIDNTSVGFIWVLCLKEKLRRVELEISIK